MNLIEKFGLISLIAFVNFKPVEQWGDYVLMPLISVAMLMFILGHLIKAQGENDEIQKEA